MFCNLQKCKHTRYRRTSTTAIVNSVRIRFFLFIVHNRVLTALTEYLGLIEANRTTKFNLSKRTLKTKPINCNYRVKLASCKSALNPPVVCSTDRPKAVVPVLVLLFVALLFILRADLLYVFPSRYYFVLVFFSPFSIAITSLG